MRRILFLLGTLVFWCAWPAFYVYFRRSYGRTRAVLVRDSKVLLVKGWISDGKWLLPGGGLHKNEPVVNGAMREVHEETGIALAADQLQHIGEGQFTDHGFRYVYQVLAATVDGAETHLQRHEIAYAWWASPKELNPQNCGQDSLVAIDLAARSGYLLQ